MGRGGGRGGLRRARIEDVPLERDDIPEPAAGVVVPTRSDTLHAARARRWLDVASLVCRGAPIDTGVAWELLESACELFVLYTLGARVVSTLMPTVYL